MKVLIVNTYDISGGAAKAACRLHRALLAEGIDSKMLVQRKESDDWTVIGPDSKIEKLINLFRPHLDQLPVKFYGKPKTPFSPSWLPSNWIVKKINSLNPDIVHLHWIAGGMLRIEDLAKIKAPIVWTLHDNWAFTGGCHVKWDCENYNDGCGRCPLLNSKRRYDLSRWIWNRKQKTFKKLNNLTIVGPSKWITNLAKESKLLRDKRCLTIPNPLDTNIFKPFDKNEARVLWNLPKDKKLLLFGAMSATSDINKGFIELLSALSKLDYENLELVIFGASKPEKEMPLKFKTHYVGYLYDDISLVTLYNACDVTVVPSLQENLANTIMESLSCGVPVVAFNIGGNSDMVVHKQNGYLATPYDTYDLAFGIKWVLSNPDYQRISQSAREKVVNEFSSHIVARRYIELYEEVLGGWNDEKHSRA